MFFKNGSEALEAKPNIAPKLQSLSEYHCSHIATCMQEIAQSWSSKSTTSNMRHFEDNEMSAELLTSIASNLNLKMNLVTSNFEDLDAQTFPCILLLNNGRGVVLVTCDKTSAKVFAKGQNHTISLASLKAVASDTIITVRQGVEKTELTLNDEKQPSSGFRNLAALIFNNNRKTLIQLLIAAAVSNMMMVALPIYIMIVYDRVIPHAALETLWALSIGVFIALGLDIGMRYIRLILTDAIALSTSAKLQSKLYHRMINARVNAVPKQIAHWVSAFRDIESATSLVPSLAAAILIDVPFVLLVLLLVYSMAGSVVAAPIIGIFLIAAWVAVSQRKLAIIGKSDADLQSRKTEDFAETVSTLSTIKAVGSQYSKLRQFERLIDDSTSVTHQSKLLSLLPPQFTMVFVQIVIVLAVIIGVYEIIGGNLSVGALAASTLLVGRVMMPVSNMMMLTARVVQLSKSIEFVDQLMDLPQEVAGDPLRSSAVKNGNLDLKNVSYSYPKTERNSVQNVSVSIKPGEKVAIVGRSGCGKSTLLKILTRFYDPDSGNYDIDFSDSRQISPDSVRDAIAYMPQDNDLFNGSVRENICISAPNASDADFEKAVNISGVQDFMRHHPEGYSFVVGPRGERLSGGERQAIALARTLIKPAKIVMLDEPTSSMDNTMENAVISAINSNLGNTSLIISTHRASVLSIVDRIIWMDKGRVIADGPRTEILSNLKASA